VKIALDSTPLTAGPGGIARYTAKLRDALRSAFPDDDVRELTDRGERLGTLRRQWWSVGLPLAIREGGIQLFHGTDFSVPYVPVCATVMTVHDLSPWLAEYRAVTSGRVRRRTPWLLRLKLATMVMTPSETVRHEVVSRFGLPGERVRATPLGVDMVGTREPKEDFVLIVGAGARKNVAVAREAAEGLAPLRVVDRDVTDMELASLYTRARVLLMPSLYEGFGLPAIEAMACGTPVIASKDAALVEVCGGAAEHVEAMDVRAWKEALSAVLRDKERASRMRAAGFQRAAGFTWEKTARATRAVYEEALKLHG